MHKNKFLKLILMKQYIHSSEKKIFINSPRGSVNSSSYFFLFSSSSYHIKKKTFLLLCLYLVCLSFFWLGLREAIPTLYRPYTETDPIPILYRPFTEPLPTFISFFFLFLTAFYIIALLFFSIVLHFRLVFLSLS